MVPVIILGLVSRSRLKLLIEQAKDLTKLNLFLNTYLNLFLSFEPKYVQLDASSFSQWRTGVYKIPLHT
jgi:hypothetical protein